MESIGFNLKVLSSIAILYLAGTTGSRLQSYNFPSCYYTAIYPKTIEPHTIYNVSVFVSEDPSYNGTSNRCSLQFRARIQYKSSSSAPYTTEPIPAGNTRKIPVAVQDLVEPTAKLQIVAFSLRRSYRDVLEAILSVTGAGARENIPIQQILLETDKPFYKLGETVRIRAVLLDSDQKPVINGTVSSVTIRDPNNFILRSWKNQSSPLGLWKGQLELSSELTLGEWGIEVRAGNQTTKISFTVKEYILPTWDVNLEVPEFLMTFESQNPWVVNVEAKYIHGQPVKGNGTLQLQLIPADGEISISRHYRSKVIYFPFDGRRSLNVSISDLEPPQKNDTIEVTLVVTEAVTGTKRSMTRTLPVEIHPYKIKVVQSFEDIFADVPFGVVFQIKTWSAVPVKSIARSELRIRLQDPVSGTEDTPYFQIDDQGFITVNLTKRDISTLVGVNTGRPSSLRYRIKVHYKGVEFEHILKAFTPVIKAEVLNYSFPKVALRVRSFGMLSQINYAVIGEKKLLQQGALGSAVKANDIYFDLDVPEMEDQVEILLYVFTIAEEKFMESLIYLKTLKKDESMRDSSLRVSISAQEVKPGHNVTLRIRSQPGSLVALKGQDLSTGLLGAAQTPWSEVLEESKPGLTAFQNSGFGYLTNFGTLSRMQRVRGKTTQREILEGRLALERLGLGVRFIALPFPLYRRTRVARAVAPTIRKFFPETWLWEEFQLPMDTDILEINRTAGDTLTSWAISGYSVNPGSGISFLEEPVKFKTFTPFFISLPLPYSVVMGEVLTLKVLIHSYFPRGGSTNVTVIIRNFDSEFEFLNQNSSSGSAQMIVNCPGQGISSVTFQIRPLKFGDLDLNVQAMTNNVVDAVSRTLRVLPPGRKVTKYISVLFVSSSGRVLQERMKPSWPAAMVPNTGSVKLSFVSNIMGSSFENLDNLIKLPQGCGEQNMLKFVVGTVALDYMEATNTIKPEVKEKALRSLQYAYQRSINYRHTDGSFSAFGYMDEKGSTWLTAFVMRSFLQAGRYIGIDNHVIDKGIAFVLSQQQKNGSFAERGRSIHSEFQGRVHSRRNAALTAYCLVTLLESSDRTLASYDQKIQAALRYLEGEVEDDQPYTLALTAFAQQLAIQRRVAVNSTAAEIVFQKLKNMAQRDGNVTVYWESEVGGVSDRGLEGARISRIKPASIETTGYALLTYLARNEYTEALPIVKWLINMRNEHGGFKSTQDTLVGLTALSQFARSTFAATTNAKVEIISMDAPHVFRIDTSTAEVIHEFRLPKSSDNDVLVQVTGNGSVVAQLTWSYYVPGLGNDPAFSISMKSSGPALEICASFNERGASSGMSIMEVDLPSGHVLNTESIGSLMALSNYKRFEVTNGDTHLSIYFDYLSNNGTCVQIRTYQMFDVEEPVPAMVNVYDYYDTTRRARALFTL